MEIRILKKSLPAGRQGFTLLELLIVIAIIGILISVGVASYTLAQKQSRDQRRRSDMKAMQSGWEQYYADNNSVYPSTCVASMTTYLPIGLPTDPKAGSSYTSSCTATSYCFCALLESGSGNATTPNCGFGSGSYYCASNLQ